ncbi:ABC transporter transmembrane domain-containing protein [Leisingera sp. F5]|uniref:ABC transporter transmembrane domain-containing protein n=2 Tax=unclassified Leisingera TaxID=2614906 RepID=UPI000AC76C95|nr:ABC transporter transmembrane domain-containing protein [Leisingera sp. F5]
MSGTGQSSTAALRPGVLKLDPDSILSAIIINLLTLALPVAMLLVFGRVIPNQSYDTLFGIFLALIAVLLIDFVLKAARAHYVLETARHEGERAGETLSDALFEGAPGALEQMGQEAAVERLMGVLGLRHAVKEQIVKMSVDLVFSVLFLLVIAAMGGWLVAAPLTVIAGLLLTVALLRPPYRTASQLQREYDKRRLSFLQEILQRAQLIKLLGLEHQMLRRYELLHASASASGEKIIRVSNAGQAAASAGSQIATVLTCALGGLLAIQGSLSVAELAASMLLTGRAVQPVIQLTFLSAVKDDDRARTSGLAKVAAVKKAAAAPVRVPVTGAITVKGLSLDRPGKNGSWFRNISFSAAPGQLIAIEGGVQCCSGAFLRILAGEVPASSGTVYLDGPGYLDPDAANSPPGLVFEPRQPALTDGEILENLTLFDPQRHTKALQAAALKLGVSSQLAQLPNGVHSQVARNGQGAGSPGFFRRLALARTFAQQPAILLLEDPFADLDPDGVRALETLLLSLQGKTTCVLTRAAPAILDAANTTIRLSSETAASSGTL